jgi:hypothetical protein
MSKHITTICGVLQALFLMDTFRSVFSLTAGMAAPRNRWVTLERLAGKAVLCVGRVCFLGWVSEKFAKRAGPLGAAKRKAAAGSLSRRVKLLEKQRSSKGMKERRVSKGDDERYPSLIVANSYGALVQEEVDSGQ